MSPSPVRSRLLIVAAAALFSTGGAAIKAAALSGWQVASFRSGVAALALLAVLPQARRGWSWRVVPVGTAYAATLILFCLANRMTTAANAIFLQATAPLYVLLLGPWLLREPIRRSDVIYILAIAAGMSLFTLGTEKATITAPHPHTGNLCAAASGFTYALTLAGLRWLSRRKSENAGMAAVAAGNVIACLAALPLALPVGAVGGANVAVILYLGIFQIGLAYWCLTGGMRRVTAFEATSVLLLEPALNPVWVWMIHGERPGTWPLAGGAVILSATLVNTWRQTRSAEPG
ncbi:MAG: DMT family transporter [Acidobacteriia bacterium]|nr:DMT family transporter [Terriglobia bacterium]